MAKWSISSLRTILQICACVAALASLQGAIVFLGSIYSKIPLDRLRSDAELNLIVVIADWLIYLAPVAVVLSIVSLRWEPRFPAIIALLVGGIGCVCLLFWQSG